MTPTEREPQVDVDLFDPRVYERGIPYADFARVRQSAPLAWQDEPAILGWPAGPGFWAVTRHADVAKVSREGRCCVPPLRHLRFVYGRNMLWSRQRIRSAQILHR